MFLFAKKMFLWLENTYLSFFYHLTTWALNSAEKIYSGCQKSESSYSFVAKNSEMYALYKKNAVL